MFERTQRNSSVSIKRDYGKDYPQTLTFTLPALEQVFGKSSVVNVRKNAKRFHKYSEQDMKNVLVLILPVGKELVLESSHKVLRNQQYSLRSLSYH